MICDGRRDNVGMGLFWLVPLIVALRVIAARQVPSLPMRRTMFNHPFSETQGNDMGNAHACTRRAFAAGLAGAVPVSSFRADEGGPEGPQRRDG